MYSEFRTVTFSHRDISYETCLQPSENYLGVCVMKNPILKGCHKITKFEDYGVEPREKGIQEIILRTLEARKNGGQ